MQQSERQYEMAKRNIGITDSYVGERDATAQSGVAKQQQVLQSSGRLESKRVEKYAAYADIDQAMFELYLAYADEPRNVPYTDDEGDAQVDVFSRYSFLEFDAVHGEWYHSTSDLSAFLRILNAKNLTKEQLALFAEIFKLDVKTGKLVEKDNEKDGMRKGTRGISSCADF